MVGRIILKIRKRNLGWHLVRLFSGGGGVGDVFLSVLIHAFTLSHKFFVYWEWKRIVCNEKVTQIKFDSFFAKHKINVLGAMVSAMYSLCGSWRCQRVETNKSLKQIEIKYFFLFSSKRKCLKWIESENLKFKSNYNWRKRGKGKNCMTISVNHIETRTF